MIEIRQLTAVEARQHLSALADVLCDCVEGGASIGFMAPFSKVDAEAFFARVIDGVERADRILLAAFDDAQLAGTVQMIHAPMPNQPHRGDIAKMLVRRSARGRGIGALLMQHIEEASWAAGKTLLVLDAVTGDPGERLYIREGWTRVGVIPNYALYPDGGPCATTFFFKQLSEAK